MRWIVRASRTSIGSEQILQPGVARRATRMSQSAHRPASPAPRCLEPEEQSRVRARPSTSPYEEGCAPTLEQKLDRARELLSALAASDPRARLLGIAVLRRDESLLDGLLAGF